MSALFYIDILPPAAERSSMAQIFVIGRVVADLELKVSANKNPYVRFDVAERIGLPPNTKAQFYQVCAMGGNAERLSKARVKKGSLIWISGTLELEEYIKQDGITKDKRLKILLDNWGYVPAGKIPDEPQPNQSPQPRNTLLEDAVNGDKEEWPG